MRLVLLLLAGLARTAGAAPVWFAHVSDMHLGHGPGQPFVAKVVAAVRAMAPKPAFVVLTGDNVEVGRPEHWANLKPIVLDPLAGYTLLFTTGNHETAWSGLEGKRLYRRFTGAPLRYAHEDAGILLVALDAAVHGQHEGHLGEDQLTWLDGVLAASAAPVKLVALHHMVFRDPGDRYIDDEAALYDVLARRGVSLVLCGHGHTNELWRYRDIPVVMTGAAYEKGFSGFRVDGRAITIVFHAFDAAGNLATGEPQAIRDAVGGLVPGIKAMNDGDLPRLDAPTLPKGVKVAWTRTLGGEILGTPLIAGGRVFVTAGDAGLFCLNPRSGKTIWSVTLAGFAMARPLLVHGMVVAGSEEGNLSAFREADGAPVWTVTLGGAVAAAPAVLGGSLLVASGDGAIHAVSFAGAVLAGVNTSGNISVEPAVRGALAFVPNWAGDLVAVDGGCRIAWTGNFPEMIYSGPGRNSPCVIGNLLVVATGKPALLGFDPASGATRWSVEEGAAYASPVGWERKGRKPMIVFQTTDGRLRVVRASDGHRVSAIEGEGSSYSARVAIAGNCAYAVALDGGVWATDLVTGRKLWAAQLTRAMMVGSPAVAGRTIVAGTMGGVLYALEDRR